MKTSMGKQINSSISLVYDNKNLPTICHLGIWLGGFIVQGQVSVIIYLAQSIHPTFYQVQ